MKVPFFDYKKFYLNDREVILSTFDEVASNGRFIMQKELDEFELAVAAYQGVKHCVGVNNATDALEILLQQFNLSSGQEVICSAHTMIATASAIRFAGATPVLADIGPDGLIDPNDVQKKITDRTAGIVVTHLNGRICEMINILKLCRENKLFLIEDAAQALGAKYRGQMAGTFGQGAAISFYPAKTLGSLGDAGCIVTDRQEVFENSFAIRDHGRNQDGEFICWGRNSRLDNVQAAILLKKFELYGAVVQHRRKLAALYDDILSDVTEVILPPSPSQDEDRFDVYQNYEIQCRSRDQLIEFLRTKEIGCLVQWSGIPLTAIPMMRKDHQCPNTDVFFERCLLIPLNHMLSLNAVEYVATTIRKFYKG